MLYLNIINKKIQKNDNQIKILDYRTGDLLIIDKKEIFEILEKFLENECFIVDEEVIKNFDKNIINLLTENEIIKEFKYYYNKIQKNIDFISRLSVDGRLVYNYKSDETILLSKIEDIIWCSVGSGNETYKVIDEICEKYKTLNKVVLIDYINEMIKNFLIYVVLETEDFVFDNPYANRKITLNKETINYKREFNDSMILFDRENGRIMVLNNYFARVIELIDGGIYFLDLLKNIFKEFGCYVYSIDEIVDFILYLNDEGYLFIEGYDNEDAKIRNISNLEKAKDKKTIKVETNAKLLVNWHNTLNNQKNIEKFLSYSTSPWFVVCEVNYQCNFKCRTCYAADYEEKEMETERDFLNLEEYKRIVLDQLYNEKVFHITFMGGEPFLRKDFREIYSYAVKKGFYVKIQTNGSLITDQVAKDLLEAKVQQVEVSLDGINAETNDKIRGRGTFDKAINGLRILKKYSIPRVGICFTVTKHSLDQIEQVVEFAKSEGIDEIFFSIYAPMSCNEDINNELKLTKEESANAVFTIRKLQEENQNMIIFAITDCEAARRVCVIGPSGDVRPCTLHSGVAGNLREKTFKEIWFYSPILRQIRWPYLFKNECRICNNKYFCTQTYCSAKEYQLSGNILSKECVLV